MPVDLNNQYTGKLFGQDRIGQTTPDLELSEPLKPWLPVPYPAPYLPGSASGSRPSEVGVCRAQLAASDWARQERRARSFRPAMRQDSRRFQRVVHHPVGRGLDRSVHHRSSHRQCRHSWRPLRSGSSCRCRAWQRHPDQWHRDCGQLDRHQLGLELHPVPERDDRHDSVRVRHQRSPGSGAHSLRRCDRVDPGLHAGCGR